MPQGSGDRKVFLTPDQHGVIILWPNTDGAESMRRFDLHNSIDPNLRVRIERSSSGFLYTLRSRERKAVQRFADGFFRCDLSRPTDADELNTVEGWTIIPNRKRKGWNPRSTARKAC